MTQRGVVMVGRVVPLHGPGGMQAAAWDLARGLARNGVPVTFLTTRVPGRAAEFEEDGVAVNAFRKARPGKYSHAWWKATRAYARQELWDRDAAVLSVSAGAYGLLPLKDSLPLRPFVLQAHGTSVGEVYSKLRQRSLVTAAKALNNVAWVPRDLQAYRQFDRVVAVGDVVRDDLTRPPARWFLPRERVRLIRNGVDTQVFVPGDEGRRGVRRALGFGEHVRLALCACRLHHQKGVDLCLRAFARLVRRNANAQLVVVGGGPARRELQDLAATLGMGDRVVFTGGVSRDRMPAFFQAADALVLTTRHREGLPLAVLEALATGVPAVVSSHLGSMLRVSQAVHGVDPRDAQSVATTLARVLTQPRVRESLLPAEYTLDVAIRAYRRVLQV